ncbi:S26 family signal peptidase [Amaricoccus sp.]|uniref:S26 family signal peptidase n=1 Tax=Amaricoccus sp. TaxID=1872485 RepID=UPI002BE1A8DE|nr:S26 family signal peptidase [Amaricoccus sp.]HMQ94489.1 S26 family signal peptidase [Amaricoccus sp.]
MNGAVLPLLGAGAGIALIAAALSDRPPRILWNASASLPIGLYALAPPGPLDLGDLVAVALPPEHAEWVAERRYLAQATLLVKRVAALPGAEVCRVGSVVVIDGNTVATAMETDSHGRPMPAWDGCVALAEHQLFLLLAETPDSLDGRYFGPTDAATIVARARPIRTWGG